MARIQLIGFLVILLEHKGNYGQSLARSKNVTMSSQHDSWAGSNVVDGKYNRNCRDKCCAATNNQTHELDPWIEIDLGETNTFTRIVLYGRTDVQYTRQMLNCLNLYLDNELVSSINTTDQIYNFYHFELTRPYSARHIKFVLGGQDKVLVICEVDVFNDTNISAGRITSSSSTYSDWVSSLAVDGLIKTHIPDECHCCAGTGRETDPWLTVDLGDTFLVTLIQIHGRTDTEYDGQSYEGLKIQLDGTDIDTVPSGQFIKYHQFFPAPEKIGRHVKFILHGSNRLLVICEAVIYGERVISFGKQASISSQYAEWKANRAVDGDYRTVVPYQCNCCTATGYQRDPYLRLNLGNIHRVTRIAVYGRTDGTYPGQNFEGMLINSSNSFIREVRAQQPSKWINFYTFQLSTPVLVSEVNVTLQGVNQQLVICELIVYGGSHYDSHHSYPTNARSNYCTKIGKYPRIDNCFVEYGCETIGTLKKGWIGHRECSAGYFGAGCSGQCHCEGFTCPTITGVCSSRTCTPGYRGTTCSEKRLRRKEESDSSAGWIIGVVAGLVVLSVIVAVAVVSYKRRRSRNRMHDKHSSKPHVALYAKSEEDDSPTLFELRPNQCSTVVQCAPANGSNESEHHAFTNTTPGIAVHQLWDYIWTNNTNKNKNDCLAAEFKKLKDGMDLFPHKDALANRKKTRYRDMSPYDHSRVHLKIDREDECDFINASYIDGYDVPRKFIASQGPIDVIVDDFWRMIWQQNSTKIVMLTNLAGASSEKAKCMQYWPVSGSLIFGRITIVLVKDDARPDYSVRTLEIRQDDGSPRRIQQFHYKAWPDKDVPDSTWSLVQFWREVFKQEDKGNFPIVVHCSAGVGRTGTFIALDNLYHQAISTGSVTPFAIVDRLREQRIKMVNTSDQYVYLHAAVSDALLFGTHYIWQSQFSAYYDFMNKNDKRTGRARLRLQYKNMIQSMSDKTSASDVKEDSVGDDNAGIYSNEINQYRPISKGYSKTVSERQNVVKLPGLSGSNSYILSTHTGAAALTDTWELIDDNNVRSVITVVDHDQTNTIWSSIEDSIVEIYNPELVIEKRVEFLTTRQFLYSKRSKGVTDRCEFTQFELQFSINAADDNSMTTLLELLNSWHPHISANQPVLIQCREGFEESAMVAVLLNENLRMTKNDGQINILESTMLATQACSACPIPFNYYKYIHDTIVQLVEKEMTGHTADEDEDGNIYQNM